MLKNDVRHWEDARRRLHGDPAEKVQLKLGERRNLIDAPAGLLPPVGPVEGSPAFFRLLLLVPGRKWERLNLHSVFNIRDGL